MKNHTLASLATIVSLLAPWGIQADATPATIKTLEVECSSKTYFTDNECDICQDGGEISTTSTGAVINAQELSWENSLTGINQNFYKSGQPSAEIKTNIGTPTTNWDQTGLDWGTDVIFTKVDIQNIFSLEAGKTVKVKTIADKTNIPITSIKDTTNPYLMVKVPISYYELAMGATSQGDKKTTNYCISYTPKITTTGSTATTPPPATTPAVTTATTTTTPPPTTTTTPVAPIPKPTTTAAPTTPTTTPPTTVTIPPKQIAIPTAATTTPPASTTPAVTTPAATTTTPPKTTTTPTTSTTTPTASTSTGITPPPTTTNTAIPAYNSNVKLNSAGPDPKIVAATKVASGPAENMYIFMAAVLLSALLYPKMRKITNKN